MHKSWGDSKITSSVPSSNLLGKKRIIRSPLHTDLVFTGGLDKKIRSGINKIKRVLDDKVVFEDEGDGFRVTLRREIEEVQIFNSVQHT